MCAVNLRFVLFSYYHHHYENVKHINHKPILWTWAFLTTDSSISLTLTYKAD